MSIINLKKKKHYAFVVPRYGKSIGGGAETLVRQLAERLAVRGDRATVLTTCAIDNRTWQNELQPGESAESGVNVLRFLVDDRDLDVWIPIQININDGITPNIDRQLDWMENSINSRDLYAHLYQHADDYDAIFFAPYLFGTTFWGSLIRPDKSILIPCLHDEHYAYLEIIANMFRQVSGALFNAQPEMELARSLYGDIRGGEVGMGFDPWAVEEVSALTPYFKESFPYLLYIGRKETGKNVQNLIDCFVAAKGNQTIPADLNLVIAGGGSFSDLHRDEALKREDLVDLSHVTEEEKRKLIKHAVCLCQPSRNESFSIVLMEAWLLSVPVLVDAAAEVTRHHVVQSGGGIYYADETEFSLVLKEIMTDENLRQRMGRAGHQYVLEKYNWEAVLARFDAVIGDLTNTAAETRSL